MNALSLPTDVEFPSLPAGLDPSSKAHLASLGQTYKRLSSLASTKLAAVVGQDASSLLEAFSSEIISTAKELRDEPLGAEEGREQRVKNLIERKRRAWRDLLNELKRIGISPSPAPKTIARLEDAGQVYSLSSSEPLLALDASALPGDVQVRLRKADAYHYRLVSQLPTLKTYPATHNADVRTPDIQRALGHIQTALATTFDQRTELIDATAKQLHLDRIVRRVEAHARASATTTTRRRAAMPALAVTQETLKIVSQALDALDETRCEISRYRTAADSPLDVSAFASLVNEGMSTLARDRDRLADTIAAMGAIDPVLLTSDELDLVSGSRDDVASVVESLARLVVPASLAYLHGPLIGFLVPLALSFDQDGPSEPTNEKTDDPLAALRDGHDNVISSILVVAQQLVKLAQGDDEANMSQGDQGELADGGVVVVGRKLRAALSALRVDEISHQVEQFARRALAALNTVAEQASFPPKNPTPF